ncbi:unnamed protein product [Paramecium sonneborni]|uniref:Actin-related protein 3 n=1 Tax=Paramecium sonneborni TaxID=65129 RepID=A0A8S1MSG7_9CILI|nr:unnamed protein product [Paramecium sonneborni]
MQQKPIDNGFYQNKVCVIDNGTGFTKMGWAGNTEPQFDIPTVVADHQEKQKVQISKNTNDNLDYYIGYEAYDYTKSHNIFYPMKSGIIENWDLMEKFWHRSIFDYLRAEPDETTFILTEPPMNPPENRENIAEIFFETFNAKGLHISVQAVLSLFSSAFAPVNEYQKTAGLTGMVLDSGDGVTHCIPVSDGYVIGSCIKHIPLAGRDITQFVQNLLKERGENIPAEDIKKVAREIKEKYGYCISDGNLIKELEAYDRGEKNKFKTYYGKNSITKEKYTIDVGYERFLGPEMFFHPEFLDGKWRSPIDEVIDKSIQSSPVDCRKKLYQNIILSGGSTLFQGFAERLEQQVQLRIDSRLLKYEQRSGFKPASIKVNVSQNPFQRFAVWQGGSLMACQPQFEKVYHTRQEYQERGPSIARYNAVFQPQY